MQGAAPLMRTRFVTLALCLAALWHPPPRNASVSITSFKVTPSTTQAGAHPDVTIDVAFGLNPASDDVKALGVVLPQGLVGDPNAADRCAIADFTADRCPATSKVGTTTASVTATVIPVVAEVPQESPGDVYNLAPQGGEPARLGVVLRPSALNAVPLPKVFLQSTVRVGPDTNYGLATQFDGLPRTSGPFDIRLDAMRLALSGQGPRGPLLTNPTACRPATTSATAFSYAEPNVARGATSSFTPTGCEALPFSPRLSGSVGGEGTTAPPTSPTVITAVSVDRGNAKPVGRDGDAASRHRREHQCRRGAVPGVGVRGRDLPGDVAHWLGRGLHAAAAGSADRAGGFVRTAVVASAWVSSSARPCRSS